MSFSLTKKRANLSLWNLNEERQNGGASEQRVLELHSHRNTGLGPLWAVLVYSPEVVNPESILKGVPVNAGQGTGKREEKGGSQSSTFP